MDGGAISWNGEGGWGCGGENLTGKIKNSL